MSQKPSQIVENIKTALPAIANAIKGNWDNIQSLNIKTNSSASLPIWSCTLDDAEGGRWNGLQAQSDEEEEGLEGDEEESDAEDKPKKGPISKGRKRSSSSDEEEEEEEKPKKKAKTTDISSTTKPKTPSISKSSKLTSAQVDSPTKKRKVTERSLTPPKAPSAIEPSIPSGKKAQKAKSTSTATPKITPSKSGLATKPSESVEKEKKKSQTSDVASQSSAPMTVDAPLKKRKTADPPFSTKSGHSPSIADTITPSAGRDKASKEKKKISKIPEAVPAPAASEKGAKPSLTREELKQKRASGTGEKKKDIISKAKGGRSAKNAVLGKKVSQV
jgi:ribosome biogenesis protein UTP30